MSVSTAVGDVTLTLQDLLTNEQNPPGLFDVSLNSPADEVVDSTTTQPKINLFLFRVTENIFIRNEDWIADGSGTLQFPPLALNLFYVITPFAENKLDEHRVLGEAMRIMHDNGILQGAQLQGSLENTSEQFKIDLVQLAIEDLTRIWTALAKPYRLSVGYEVRTVSIDSSISQQTSRVTQFVAQFTQGGGS
jgi:Pvc16 N-terminal domain